MEELKQGLMDSKGVDVCKGFAVGRSIFGEPSRRWLRGDYDDEQFVQAVLDNYMALVNAWQMRQQAA